MFWVWTLLGAAVIGVGLREVFHTLLHPSGRGRISHVVVVAVWNTVRAVRPSAVVIAGPLAVLAVIGLWATLQVVGWALVYLPHIPDGFVYAAGIAEWRYPDPIEALYISLVAVTTLGYGDVVAVAPGIRLLTPIEAFFGLGLLTAAVSWFLQIYPALAHRRTLAIRVVHMEAADYLARMPTLSPGIVHSDLSRLAQDITRMRVDLSQTSEAYYFREHAQRTSIPDALGYCMRLAEAACGSENADLRAAGEILRASVADFTDMLASEFRLSGETSEEIIRSYAEDQHRAPVRWAKTSA